MSASKLLGWAGQQKDTARRKVDGFAKKAGDPANLDSAKSHVTAAAFWAGYEAAMRAVVERAKPMAKKERA